MRHGEGTGQKEFAKTNLYVWQQVAESATVIILDLNRLCSSFHSLSIILLEELQAVESESTLRSPVIFLSRVRAPPPVPCPDGGSESLRAPC
ncbi:hypothetical protein PoB_005866900 [Plakobranchus ocellatus]|uniref:Uncharacterized protein n=1 Tax=Plakobranchus ocellatus TaxID=259542 RepID=A0AAV4CHD9_9GAST|nr:hypothetical protein PoB_005866900 [Plakobranchus ocellatus]